MKRIVTILGATGTGKSDLAVYLAKKFNGEVINADVMQIYKGLPILTNKITEEEKLGIPHHLLDFHPMKDLVKPESRSTDDYYNIHNFTTDTLNLIQKIQNSGKLPILAGGTYYYLQNILFENIKQEQQQKISNDSTATSESNTVQNSPGPIPSITLNNQIITKQNSQNFTSELYQELEKLDPIEATRTHKNNHRKILTKLLFIQKHNSKYSDFIDHQRTTHKNNYGGKVRFGSENCLIFSLECKNKEVYEKRLQGRLDKMYRRGLLEEVFTTFDQFYAANPVTANSETSTESEPVRPEPNFHVGLFQTLGFKDFYEYYQYVTFDLKLDLQARLEFTDEKIEKFKNQISDSIFFKTRRYGNWQIKRTEKALLENCVSENLKSHPGMVFGLDSSNASQFMDQVVDPAILVTEKFLNLESEQESNLESWQKLNTEFCYLLNKTEQNVETIKIDVNKNQLYQCEICESSHNGFNEYQIHLKSRKHRKMLARKIRLENGGKNPEGYVSKKKLKKNEVVAMGQTVSADSIPSQVPDSSKVQEPNSSES